MFLIRDMPQKIVVFQILSFEWEYQNSRAMYLEVPGVFRIFFQTMWTTSRVVAKRSNTRFCSTITRYHIITNCCVCTVLGAPHTHYSSRQWRIAETTQDLLLESSAPARFRNICLWYPIPNSFRSTGANEDVMSARHSWHWWITMPCTLPTLDKPTIVDCQWVVKRQYFRQSMRLVLATGAACVAGARRWRVCHDHANAIDIIPKYFVGRSLFSSCECSRIHIDAIENHCLYAKCRSSLSIVKLPWTYVNLQDESYDAIVLGTGLKECILSGLLSVEGKKVCAPHITSPARQIIKVTHHPNEEMENYSRTSQTLSKQVFYSQVRWQNNELFGVYRILHLVLPFSNK